LRTINKDFFDYHRNAQIPTVSMFAGGETPPSFRPVLAGHREGILQQSMDLIAGTSGEVLIFAGDLSWLKELQVPVAAATYAKRPVRILCDQGNERGSAFWQLVAIARNLGASVGVINRQVPIRGTLVAPNRDSCAMMCVGRHPNKHATLLRSPHEAGLLNVLAEYFETFWQQCQNYPGAELVVETITLEKLQAALTAAVPAYQDASFSVDEVDPMQLRPLTKCLNRFKLFRLQQVEVFLKQIAMQSALIRGSPWPICLPIVEEMENGELVVIDGAHRVFAAISRGAERLMVVRVSNVQEKKLPGTPLDSWDSVRVLPGKVSRTDRYLNYDSAAFRPIAEAFATLTGIQHSA